MHPPEYGVLGQAIAGQFPKWNTILGHFDQAIQAQ